MENRITNAKRFLYQPFRCHRFALRLNERRLMPYVLLVAKRQRRTLAKAQWFFQSLPALSLYKIASGCLKETFIIFSN